MTHTENRKFVCTKCLEKLGFEVQGNFDVTSDKCVLCGGIEGWGIRLKESWYMSEVLPLWLENMK